jgi:3',5'-cyclic AMP phosphodiesterase CpdA
VTARVLHVSDFHLGRGESATLLPALRRLAVDVEPELVLVTGDVAHRGRLSELERAAGAIRSLGLPFLAVPGNHDIPYTVPARFTKTYATWDRVFGSHESVYASEHLKVVGLSSVRPWRQQSGRLRASQLELVARELGGASDGTLRVVALHHHLAAPPWRARRKRPLHRRDAVLRQLAEAGAELVVGGHVHQAGVAERREFEVLSGEDPRGLVLSTAPGFGRPRPRRKGEAQGANVYEGDAETLTVTTYAWDGNVLAQVGRRVFSRA